MEVSITDSELEIMRVLWRATAPMTCNDIQAEIEPLKSWNKSTTITLVARLRDKGAIRHLDKYGAAQYVPVMTEDEYILMEEKAVVEKFRGAKALLSAMVRNGHLTESDIAEMREYFKVKGSDGNG
jgi:BlaI family penicillinase repressor